MPTLVLITEVAAPQTRCFDLARCVEFHLSSMRHTGERAVAGTTYGLLTQGDTITWEGRHLFVRQRLTSRITAFERPHFFADEMVQGAFHSFRHEHRFETVSTDLTRVTDTFTFRSPLGPLGHVADALFLRRYMYRLLSGHQQNLKNSLEDGTWARFLPDHVQPPPPATL